MTGVQPPSPGLQQTVVSVPVDVFGPDAPANCTCGLGLGTTGSGLPDSVEVSQVLFTRYDTKSGQHSVLMEFAPLSPSPQTSQALAAGPDQLFSGATWFGFSGEILPFTPPELGPDEIFTMSFVVNFDPADLPDLEGQPFQFAGGIGDPVSGLPDFHDPAHPVRFFGPGSIASCVPTYTALCLNQGRFEVALDWRTARGRSGQARAVPCGSDDSGLLFFFAPDNWEMLVKVLDACTFNDRFWVFFGATTNVEFTLAVTDTLTDAQWSYTNPQGTPAPPVQDTGAFATCAAGCPLDEARALADRFVAHPRNSGLFSGATVRSLGRVSAVSDAVDAVVTGAAFVSYPPEPFQVFRLDSQSVPDSDVLADALAEYSSYVEPQLAEGDCLFEVEWFSPLAPPFTTVGVTAADGTVKFEPLSDLVMDLTGPPGTEPTPDEDAAGAGVRRDAGGFPAARQAPTGVDLQEWKNLLGITKAAAVLEVTALGADGCQARFSASFISTASFPFVVEPASASPDTFVTCWSKSSCTCREEPSRRDRMECGQSNQPYSVIARIGTQWFGADLATYPGTVRAWACADGQAGAGNF